MTFEEKNERLKQIIEKLQDKNTDLSTGSALFDEGVKLAKECMEELNNAKGKITEITDLTE